MFILIAIVIIIDLYPEIPVGVGGRGSVVQDSFRASAMVQPWIGRGIAAAVQVYSSVRPRMQRAKGRFWGVGQIGRTMAGRSNEDLSRPLAVK